MPKLPGTEIDVSEEDYNKARAAFIGQNNEDMKKMLVEGMSQYYANLPDDQKPDFANAKLRDVIPKIMEGFTAMGKRLDDYTALLKQNDIDPSAKPAGGKGGKETYTKDDLDTALAEHKKQLEDEWNAKNVELAQGSVISQITALAVGKGLQDKYKTDFENKVKSLYDIAVDSTDGMHKFRRKTGEKDLVLKADNSTAAGISDIEEFIRKDYGAYYDAGAPGGVDTSGNRGKGSGGGSQESGGSNGASAGGGFSLIEQAAQDANLAEQFKPTKLA